MPCIKAPNPDTVRDLNEESFIREGKGRLKIIVESEGGEKIETTISGSLKSVDEMAEMLGGSR